MATLIYGTHRFELDPDYKQNEFAKELARAKDGGLKMGHGITFQTFNLKGGGSITLTYDPAIPFAVLAD